MFEKKSPFPQRRGKLYRSVQINVIVRDTLNIVAGTLQPKGSNKGPCFKREDIEQAKKDMFLDNLPTKLGPRDLIYILTVTQELIKRSFNKYIKYIFIFNY